MVLRYEYSISEPAITLSASEDEELAALSTPTGGMTVTTSYSTKDAIAARIAVPHDRPRFAKPLFYVLLFGVFAVHIPAIILSTPFVFKSTLFNAAMHPRLSGAAELFLTLPAQIWTVILLPFLVGSACLIREDGTALWRYQDVFAKPVVPGPPPDSENDVATSPTEAGKQAGLEILDNAFLLDVPI